ncbi:Putative peptidoglycan binding domain-containing protein [Devosia lucknowensis]|uniref:Putative peptidoglycan binding domain-containing protein n=1 Tax=Devosia lucknowensis TaxID=1096929 RepID=A0A1Y6EK96_9HYPH|nr:peptidoglycan-binding domain-containing protein [Devosia lucknowensis]SMQ60982.1 Putative peptidoglycan binding domain-containing protein [Devosia lucknowensis]
MTASTLTQLPLMAGGALLGTLSKATHWTFARYMRAPLASTGLLAMVTMTALAGSNALFFQTAHHPSPFFAPARGEVMPLPTPVVDRPAAEPAAVQSVPEIVETPVMSTETTGSVEPAPAIPDGPVGNAQMFAVQKKLFELQLFSGKVDGYYGPKTAEAIRAFETRNGMTPTGANDPTVFEVILGSDSAGRAATPVAQQPQAAAPAPVAQPVAVVETQTAQQDQIVARLPALSPGEQVLDGVANSAASTIDTIMAAVDGGGSRGSAPETVNPPTPRASLPETVSSVQTQPMPAPVQPAPVQTVQVASAAPVTTPASVPPATDAALVTQIQKGLASLGFFRGPIDGRPGAETARAIREFENFHRYKMTGQVQPDLVDLLVKAGATI